MSYKLFPKIDMQDRKRLDKYSDIMAQILKNRGLSDNKAAEDFIEVDYEKETGDPFKLKDIDIAVDRIIKAITKEERICIYSDYDADGIPGAVILSDFFKKIKYFNFFSYIPHRNREGFGLNKKAIDKIYLDGARLIITVDCGISDVEQIDYACTKNIDIIVTDHHDPNNHKSKAIAVINPKQKDCNYGDKNLCGAAVVFKVVEALIKKGNFDINPGWEKWLLDLVGIATLSDMVPLIGENRVLAKYGLTVIKKSPRKGLVYLLKECRLDQNKITEDDVGFSVAPRINAASRMDEPEIAYRMLYTDSDVEAKEAVKHLHKINDERKGVVASMVKEIKKDIGETHSPLIVVKGNTKWSPSLLGLAANSIVEKYKRPAFLWGRGVGENLKGSCRSDGSVDLVNMMNFVKPGIIGEFGGHEMAGGFIVYEDSVDDLEQELENAYKKAKSSSDKLEKMIDIEITIDDVNWTSFNEIQKLAPFGVGNDRPVFLLKNLTIHKSEKFGKDKNHLKISFQKKNKEIVNAIKFFSDESEMNGKLIDGQKINLLASMEKSSFGRYPELRLKIIEIKTD